jgi:hypothetical protein
MDTSRELVIKTVRFQNPDRLPIDFPEEYGSDFFLIEMTPSPDYRPSQGVDEWGAVWKNIGVCKLGEVEDFPLKSWRDFNRLKIPDIDDPRRWRDFQGVREKAGDKFLMSFGISIYERVHFLRGLENTWMDIYDAPDMLCRLIDILVELNLRAIEKFARFGVDGIMITDDWGLQNRLMIHPDAWREIWKPRYRTIFEASRSAGIVFILHSCGYILDILDDLVEAGLEVIQMDQQENMGLELLGERFGGRITFFSPVDIQKTMVEGSLEDIRQYCRRMLDCLGTQSGGFIPKWYSDPAGAGHRPEAIQAMCEEFLALSRERYSPIR